jgi:hypothetical protein
MEDQPFDEPVHVLLGPPGKIRVVTSALQAADALLNQWPTQPTRRHRTARQAVVDALEGIKDAKAARRGEGAAADEASILVPIDRIMIKRK